MEKAKKGSYMPYIVVVAICLLIVSYVIYHISSLFSEEFSTIISGVVTETESISGTGYVFRDETLLYSSNGGVVDYLATDGEKVGKGQALADVYELMPTGVTRESVALLDFQIAILEESIAGRGTDMTALRASLSETYYLIARGLADGDLSGVSENSRSMLQKLNMIQSLLDGEGEGIKQTLSELKSMRADIISSAGASVKESTETPGYFYSGIDGYESSFSASFIENASGDDILALIEGRSAEELSRECYGKLAENSDWYFAVPMNKTDAKKLAIGEIYTVNITSGSYSSMPMTLARIDDISGGEQVVLIFSADRLPKSGSLDRCLNISIDIDSVSGIYVPKTAIEYQDGQRGVYILKGSVVRFRAVSVLYERNDYYLVDPNFDDEESSFAYLSSNEQIIINGQNLFDGRILD